MSRDGATGTIKTLLGPGASFEGKLSFEGTVRLEGSFKGEVFTDDELVIGEGATVDAEVKVGTIVVHGEVKGNITAQKSVELHHPAKVFGNISTPSLTIEKGVVFEGTCRMQNLDKSKTTNESTTSASSSRSSASPGDGGSTATVKR